MNCGYRSVVLLDLYLERMMLSVYLLSVVCAMCPLRYIPPEKSFKPIICLVLAYKTDTLILIKKVMNKMKIIQKAISNIEIR